MKRNVIVASILVVIFGALIATVWYYSSTYVLTVNYKNVKKVSVVDSKSKRTAQTLNPAASSTDENHVRLFKDGSYTLSHEGANGYADGSTPVTYTSNGDNVIMINPYFSSQKLDELLTSEAPQITKVITDTYPTVTKLYSIDRGSLYHFGEWYGTTLTYQGDDVFDTDTLRLVMKKEGTTWKLITTPPVPLLTTYNTKDIPLDILKGVNGLE